MKFIEYFFTSRVEGHYFLSREDNLIGLRPGGLIIGSELKQSLSNPKETPWNLINKLLRRLSAGMVIMNDLADTQEALINQLASSGVIVSWFYFISKRSRNELIYALGQEQVNQCLRLELMIAILKLQGIHLNNSPYLNKHEHLNS